MFLIEFKKDMFIDAERINFINLNDDKVKFTLADRVTFSLISDSGTLFFVDKVIESPFLNQLQALNQSLTNPEARHHHINNPNTKY